MNKENSEPKINLNNDYVLISYLINSGINNDRTKMLDNIACDLEGRLSVKAFKSPCIIYGECTETD